MISMIAVILINYNDISDTLECIKSIQRSHCAYSVRIIVVDNASADNEADKLRAACPDVVVIASSVNGGFSAGNNLGIRYALSEGAEYICLLNNDTVIASDMLERLVRLCNSATVATPIMYYYNEPNRIWFAGGSLNRWTGNAEHHRMGDVDPAAPDQIPCAVVPGTSVDACGAPADDMADECTFATGCCFMLHADTIRTVGLLEESYFMYCEDTEYSIRLMRNNVRILNVSSARLWHKVSRSTGGSTTPFSTYYITRNRLNYLRTYKEVFYPTAYPYSLLSRYLRMLQTKDASVRAAFRKAIRDHRNGIDGQVDLSDIYEYTAMVVSDSVVSSL